MRGQRGEGTGTGGEAQEGGGRDGKRLGAKYGRREGLGGGREGWQAGQEGQVMKGKLMCSGKRDDGGVGRRGQQEACGRESQCHQCFFALQQWCEGAVKVGGRWGKKGCAGDCPTTSSAKEFLS